MRSSSTRRSIRTSSPSSTSQRPPPRDSRQAQGDAGRGPERLRPHPDRNRLSGGRDRAGAADQDPARLRVEVPEPDGELPAGGGRRCRSSRRIRASNDVHAGRTAARVQPRQGEAGAHDAGGAPRVVQGESQQAHLRAAGELRSRAHVHHGAAVHSRRQESEGSGQRLGEDLGVSQGVELLHRVLPDGNRRGDEGARRRLARHDADDDRMGHQSARARHRARRTTRSRRSRE